MYSWPVNALADVTREDFALLIDELGQFDWLLIGTGADMARPKPLIGDYLASKSIPFEFMSTSAAVRTYNVVLAEQRRVAAALIAVGSPA